MKLACFTPDRVINTSTMPGEGMFDPKPPFRGKPVKMVGFMEITQ